MLGGYRVDMKTELRCSRQGLELEFYEQDGRFGSYKEYPIVS